MIYAVYMAFKWISYGSTDAAAFQQQVSPTPGMYTYQGRDVLVHKRYTSFTPVMYEVVQLVNIRSYVSPVSNKSNVQE